MKTSAHVLILDDGDTWELVWPGSTALVVEVTQVDLERLGAGEPVSLVLAGRRGQRLSVVIEAARAVAPRRQERDTGG